MDRHGNYNNETLFEEITGAIKVDLMCSVPLQISVLFSPSDCRGSLKYNYVFIYLIVYTRFSKNGVQIFRSSLSSIVLRSLRKLMETFMKFLPFLKQNMRDTETFHLHSISLMSRWNNWVSKEIWDAAFL